MKILTFLSIFLSIGCQTAPYEESRPEHRSAQVPGKSATSQDAQNAAEERAIAAVIQSVKTKNLTDYKISPEDRIKVTVYREEDLSRVIRVSQRGTISFPLIGVIDISGKSIIQTEEIFSTKLKEYLVNPQVTVFIEEYGSKQIYVLGEVKNPGSFDLPTEKKLMVLEAITIAGGFSPIAAKDRTKVIRAGQGGKSESFTIEVSAITSRGEKEKDIQLLPNDVIFIPQSFF